MKKRLWAMRYYVSNGEGMRVLVKLMLLFAVAASVATACLVAWEVHLAFVLMLAGWLWCLFLWLLNTTIAECRHSLRLARTVGKGAEAEVQLAEFEAAQPFFDDRFRVGERFVFARKGGVIPFRQIRRAYLLREHTKEKKYKLYVVEEISGTRRILGRWEAQQFCEQDEARIVQALSEKQGGITFGLQ